MRRPILVVSLLLISSPALLPGQDSEDTPHGDLTLDCGECHNPERWVPVDTPPSFRHDSTGFELKASHTQVACRQCHQSLVFHQVGTACADCHRDAHRGELGFRCESCHTPATWTNQRDMFQAHSGTRFPLLAVHARLDCAACHANQEPWQYATTPAECGNCHLEAYLQTTDPGHVEAGFSRRCEDCHFVEASTWRDARFAHPESFPLVGGHARLACARCHTGGSYGGLSRVCYSCHQADYAATTDPGHQSAGFPTQCEVCHTTAAWRPAIFDHDGRYFPIYSGRHRGAWSSCADCHVNPGSYQAFECIFCHAHSNRAALDREHREVSGYVYQSAACYRCHPDGRGEDD